MSTIREFLCLCKDSDIRCLLCANFHAYLYIATFDSPMREFSCSCIPSDIRCLLLVRFNPFIYRVTLVSVIRKFPCIHIHSDVRILLSGSFHANIYISTLDVFRDKWKESCKQSKHILGTRPHPQAYYHLTRCTD